MSVTQNTGTLGPPRGKVRRAVAASTAGSTIEWYDFQLYGVVAAIVLPAAYFPESSALAGTLLSFSTFFVGFVARPLGAVLFGHLGDRVGRKKALVVTLMLMGIGTVGIGLTPGYSAIGPAAPLLLVLMRVVQGFGVGGEWSGAILMAGESGRRSRQAFLTSFPQASAMLGTALASLSVLAAGAIGGPAAFIEWTWRIPFLISAVLVVLGLWMRHGIGETTEFAEVRAQGKVERAPVLTAMRSYWREILLGMFLKVGEMAPVFIFVSFIYTYGKQVGGLSQTTLLAAVSVAALVSALITPLMGYLGDRLGPVRVYLIGAAAMAVEALGYFAAIGSGNHVLAIGVIVVSLVPYALMFANEATILTGLFPAPVRYSGSSLAFNLAGILGGGPAPFIAAGLLSATGTAWSLTGYLLLTVLVGATAAVLIQRRGHS
ncbi:MFS transporter [Amycolatopsis jejuensis]|uniref:MFS transporter n=1 Tax=Amycolatopsis jejuensis TaxID=330084 RepID=UPI00068BB2DD|nr:MFS transporter [Amycolatopsis jejuensis]